jgi:hypothetical protein
MDHPRGSLEAGGVIRDVVASALHNCLWIRGDRYSMMLKIYLEIPCFVCVYTVITTASQSSHMCPSASMSQDGAS